jgi:hypothetical protein
MLNLDETSHTWHGSCNFSIDLPDGTSWWKEQTAEHLEPIVHALASRKLEG